MRRLKKVAAIVSLAMVICMGASVSALAGTQEVPGISVGVGVETPDGNANANATVTGVIETPGFSELILFAVNLIM